MANSSQSAPDLALLKEQQGGVRIVKASGRVDFSTTPQFHETLRAEAQDAGSSGGLIVDLGGLDLITSAGLRALMQTKKQLSEAGAALVITGVHGTVADVIQVSRFDTLLTIKPTIEDAIEHLAPDQSSA